MTLKFANVKPGRTKKNAYLLEEYAEDLCKKKVNLIEGAYRDEKGKPWVFPVVQKTETMLATDENAHHEYLPFLGSNQFSTATTRLLLGNDCIALRENRAFGIQTVGGAGGLAVGARLLAKTLSARHFYYSNPSWDGHDLIFRAAGFEEGFSYRYWNAETRGIDIDGLLEDLANAEENSVVILHACGHNPTGCDPTFEQWTQIARLMKEKELFPFFDSSYQGTATGDLDEDAAAVRLFVEQGFELLCAQSFAKNFGLYGERVGNLTFVVNDANTIPVIKTQLEDIVIGMYRSPPCHGSNIVFTILNDASLFEEWRSNLKIINARLNEMRMRLREKLEKLGTPGSWKHITSQIGFYTYTGLTPSQMDYLRSKCHIYALRTGRLNIGGLNILNLDYVADSIHEAVVNVPENPAVSG